MDCNECLVVEGTLSAFTHLNVLGKFEKMGFIMTQKDGFEQKLVDGKWQRVQTSYEEWALYDMKYESMKEFNGFMERLRCNGIHQLTYTPRIDPTRVRRPDWYSKVRIGRKW